MTKPESERIERDPEDGLPRSIVGEWSLKKHHLLCRYVDTCRATRRKWLDREPAFLDLFCGPGRWATRASPPRPALPARIERCDTSTPLNAPSEQKGSLYSFLDQSATLVRATSSKTTSNAKRCYWAVAANRCIFYFN